jgi:L-glutamine-phosphate cytidylyltransferase
VELRFNPFWAVSSSIGSAWMARDAFKEAFCLMNGDTTLTASILRRAMAAIGDCVSLVVEPLGEAAPDDMLARVEDRRVVAVSKTLDSGFATHRSLGVVLGARGSGYGTVLERVIAGEDGIQAFHHDVVAALAAQRQVTAIVEAEGGWAEIDRPEDIERWTTRAGTNA